MSVLSLRAIGFDARQPSPRAAANHSPLLISTTAPSTTSPMVGSPSPSGASATLVHAASSPASAGRVPSIGSTTRTNSAPPPPPPPPAPPPPPFAGKTPLPPAPPPPPARDTP